MRHQAKDIPNLKTCDQRGEFKKRPQAVLAISGSDEDHGEDQRARRD
jgi:hypothetical protein